MTQALDPKSLRHILGNASEEERRSLGEEADRVRRRHVGESVHLRGLVEFSNVCARSCLYCGLRAPRRGLQRYRLSAAEIFDAARRAADFGYGTVVLQSGEDPDLDVNGLADVVRRIRGETRLAVTLSLGERPRDDLERLRRAGADRYLLKHETANAELYARLRPGCRLETRLATAAALRDLGYQVGGGCMVGLPGQSPDDLAEDLRLMATMDLDMAGVGPFVPSRATPLAADPLTWPPKERVRATYLMMALLRLLLPDVMMPVTTSLTTLDPDAYRKGLACGANVVMPPVVAAARRAPYRLYPGRPMEGAEPDEIRRRVLGVLAALGRPAGSGPGHALRASARRGGGGPS